MHLLGGFVWDCVLIVVDDDNTDKVTAGSLVTLSVTLRRSSLLEKGLMQMDDTKTLGSALDGDEVFYRVVHSCLPNKGR